MFQNNQSLEKFFLGSLIKEINEESKNSEETRITISNVNFNKNLEKNSGNNLNKSSNDISSLNYITKEEIFNYLSKQKTGILLQNKIKEVNNEEIAFILNELKGFFSKIMKDKNGNYFTKDLFKLCNFQQRLIILKEISKDFISLSIHHFSTHPIQTLIELCKNDEEYKIINSVFFDNNNFLLLCLNSNGSFVIQKIISIIPKNKREIINDLLIKNFKILVCDMYGVCILKKFIIFSKNIFQKVIFCFFQDFEKICEDKYGNYFIQFILELYWDKKEIIWIKNSIIRNFLNFAINQYASHVCEAYINLCTLQEKKLLLKYLVENGIYYILLNNVYGLFVIGKLNCCKNNQNLS